MSLEQVLAAQGQATMPASTPIAPPPNYSDGLTAREVEVLRLITSGLTDAQAAEQLVISPRTVNKHLTTIYSKIQVSTRSAATRYAIEHQIVCLICRCSFSTTWVNYIHHFQEKYAPNKNTWFNITQFSNGERNQKV